MSDFKLTDYERGEYDCVHGHQARDCESDDYYLGYGTQYAKDQNATWYSEKVFEDILADKQEKRGLWNE